MKKLLVFTVVLSCILLGFISVFKIEIQTFYNTLYSSNPEISVVMATYNREKSLPNSIQSILNQTFKNFELIIVDDGSRDNTAKLLYNYLKKDKRIRVYRNKRNRGIPYTRNKLLDLSRGKYMAIMDSDDYSFPIRLEEQLNYMKQHPNIMVLSSQILDIDSKKDISRFWSIKGEDIAINLIFFSPLCNPSTFYNLDFIKSNHIRYDETLRTSEDYDFWRQIFLKGGEFDLIQMPLLAYRFYHKNSKIFYQSQKNNALNITKKIQNVFFPTNDETEKISRCEKLKKIYETNKQLKLLKSKTIQKEIKKHCKN